MPHKEVAVVIGLGDMGLAIARRIASGRTIVIADRDAGLLHRRTGELTDLGYQPIPVEVDVTDPGSLIVLSRMAAELGPVMAMVHTAGVSPVHATIETILAVDLLGTALVLDAMGPVIANGGSGVVIASMAAQLFPALDPQVERELATIPANELLALESAQAGAFSDPASAYAFAKQANIVRVAALCSLWGRRGSTLNSISPGVISTAMGRQELEGANGEAIRQLVQMSGAGRVGTPDDIADATHFLLGPSARFITGTNLIVDGGVTAAVRF